MSEIMNETAPQVEPKWQPLSAIQRRIVGVLVEKAKTTPDGYPLSLNGLTTGCNQKSNRSPRMNLTAEQVEDALDGLRSLGAVAEVQGDGRVPKYRHYMKDWMAVSGTELAVMAELLLRGPQTAGELRGRAARMAAGQLPDLASLRPVLKGLENRRLVIALSPEGRGQIVSHALYQPSELVRIKQKHASSSAGHATTATTVVEDPLAAPAPVATASTIDRSVEIDQLRHEVASLRDDLATVKKEIEDIWANLR